jgi:hypothetical protein
MRASADPISVIPDDVTILPITACAAALGLTERKARQLLHEEQIPVARLGARSGGCPWQPGEQRSSEPSAEISRQRLEGARTSERAMGLLLGHGEKQTRALKDADDA